MTLKIDL